MQETVLLVDEHDRPLGTADKLDAHKRGLLHRAVSVFLFNDRGNLLVQQRAPEKYHCPGLWSNSCCSHPLPEEDVADAARRRVAEELGIECTLVKFFQQKYRSALPDGLVEHEIDHIFAGRWNSALKLNASEVSQCRWLNPYLVMNHMLESPTLYTPWFRTLIASVMMHYSRLRLTNLP
jgi:isopentenyl-diphosphate delta-isomerase